MIDAASAQCASSTATSSSCRSARLAVSQYSPYSTEPQSEADAAFSNPDSAALAAAAAPSMTRARSFGPIAASGAANS